MLQRFLIQSSYSNYNIESIIEPLQEGKVNLYELMDSYVSYLVSVRQVNNAPLAPTSIALRVYAIRSNLQYYDIDINPSKFRRRVRLPKLAREDEQAIDASDIRKILLACNNRRLKAYLFVLASGGMRALEALAIRNKDLDFTVSPTKVHIRKEYTKTKVGRNIYISDEATAFLKQWLDWKYSPEREFSAESAMAPAMLPPDDLVFSQLGASDPNRSYQKLVVEYHKLLDVVGLGERKDNSRRRKVTLHSLRRFAKSVIAEATNQDFSEFFLGHKKSPYYVRKEQELRELYKTRCMKQLTFLDYTSIEVTTKEVETRLREKDMEIERLRNLDALSRDAIRELSDRLMRLEAKFNGS
jgi:integrase